MVFVNQACWTAPDLPFGGVKNSATAASFPISASASS